MLNLDDSYARLLAQSGVTAIPGAIENPELPAVNQALAELLDLEIADGGECRTARLDQTEV